MIRPSGGQRYRPNGAPDTPEGLLVVGGDDVRVTAAPASGLPVSEVPTSALRTCAIPLDVPAEVGVAEAVRRLAGRERVTAWSGAWSRGGLVTCDPAPLAGPADPFLPAVPAPEPGDALVGGGWFGYLSFPGRAAPFPRHSLAWYPDVLRFDGAAWWYEALLGPGPYGISAERAAERRAAVVADLHRPSSPVPARLRGIGPEGIGPAGRTAHVVAVEEAVRAIRRGEIYQVNIATQLDARFTGSAHDAWARLVEAHGPARAGFVADPAGTAVSASPELFLHREGRVVRTAPIKGTRPRTGAADQHERARLAASAKDAAENVMIVDLMRNDLARVCATGTVTVPRLLAVEPHAGVWHLVSEVRGTLAAGRDDADLLRAAFPPGSVTGTPKIRAVELIEELEAAPRGLFTGALGYLSPLAGLELAVAIRTLELTPDGRARLGVGGGVTVDSTPAEEWAECLTKAAPVLEVLGAAVPAAPTARVADPAGGIFETILLRGGRVRRLADHVGRLRRSYWEAYGVRLSADVEAAVALALAAEPTRTAARMRVVAHPGSPDRVRVAVAPFEPVPLAAQPGLVLRVCTETAGERHKLVDRAWLDAHEAAVGAGETPLLVDDAGPVLESTRSSVFTVRDGLVRTPPLDGRILPGTARQAVLDERPDARPAVVTLGELAGADGAFLTNALRGVQWVRELRDAGGSVLARWAEPGPETIAIAAALDADER
ncbi:MAG: para-aminobenzoate synthetase / 4-amino-4-deoxychorismate lyase [Pseudonocardiales bacterium]|jgi:para-aminobenzoate synthetase/4-amino-4-deoxychorismate lyase|nr:para-aminobenzoate synthetase / 4-amino-4-deoxychorismate lyase [Pseudonocardiales bacterium]